MSSSQATRLSNQARLAAVRDEAIGARLASQPENTRRAYQLPQQLWKASTALLHGKCLTIMSRNSADRVSSMMAH